MELHSQAIAFLQHLFDGHMGLLLVYEFVDDKNK